MLRRGGAFINYIMLLFRQLFYSHGSQKFFHSVHLNPALVSSSGAVFSYESVQQKISTAAVQFSAAASETTSLQAPSVQLVWKAGLLNYCMLEDSPSLESVTFKQTACISSVILVSE